MYPLTSGQVSLKLAWEGWKRSVLNGFISNTFTNQLVFRVLRNILCAGNGIVDAYPQTFSLFLA
jgi:hypothetical protein